jgi:hypothetical protein
MDTIWDIELEIYGGTANSLGKMSHCYVLAVRMGACVLYDGLFGFLALSNCFEIPLEPGLHAHLDKIQPRITQISPCFLKPLCPFESFVVN